MAKLTVKELEALGISNVGNIIRDDGGLRGVVRANRNSKNGVSVTFVYRFRWSESTRDYPCGTWPAESLPEIRKRRNQARDLVGSGINPIEHKKIAIQAQQADAAAKLKEIEQQKTDCLTVNDLFIEWAATINRKDGGAEINRLFGRDVIPKIGAVEVRLLTEKNIRHVLALVVERGSNRMATMLLSTLKQMFRWAEKRRPWKKLIEDNPVEHIEAREITAQGYEDGERSRALSSVEIKELSEKLPNAGLLHRTEIAMWIMLACCCRIGEIIKARWEHVDLESGIWTIPKENAKNKVAHTVYLSAFVLPYFKKLRELAGDSDWCYPDFRGKSHVCVKSTTKQIRDRQMMAQGRKPMKNRSQLGDALLLSGGEWVPHDLRRTGATLLQSLGVKPETIERVLNHIEPNKLRRTYQTYDYADEKREAWRLLGERLALITGENSNVIPGAFAKVA